SNPGTSFVKALVVSAMVSPVVGMVRWDGPRIIVHLAQRRRSPGKPVQARQMRLVGPLRRGQRGQALERPCELRPGRVGLAECEQVLADLLEHEAVALAERLELGFQCV